MSGQLVTVVGLERNLILRAANCVECDSCHTSRTIPVGGIDQLRAEGWTGPMRSFQAEGDRCPDC